MSSILDSFLEKKKAESSYISLQDGESVKIEKLNNMKVITKVGFGGDEVEVLRLYCTVMSETQAREKYFDNGTARFAKELKDKGVDVGSSFVLTRSGEKAETRYEISDVKNPAGAEVPAA